MYFMKGNDERLLTANQQREIAGFVKTRSFSDSFFIYNRKELQRKLADWKNALPWIRPYYAVKANPIGQILSDLIAGGAGMDCASIGEIQQAEDLGLPTADIVYSHPIKDIVSLKQAVAKGISLTTADSLEELKKLQTYAPTMKVLWRIAIQEQAIGSSTLS